MFNIQYLYMQMLGKYFASDYEIKNIPTFPIDKLNILILGTNCNKNILKTYF